MTRRPFETIEVPVVAAAAILLFFSPVLFMDRTFFLRDIQCQFYPMKYYLGESMKAGLIPWWCPSYYCGAPFMSDIQSGVFYPLSVLFALFPFPLAFNLYVVAHFFLGFIFWYHFVKGIGLSRESALFTGISYCFGGYMIASVISPNHLSAMIWLPAILWSFHRAEAGRRLSGSFWTVFFLAMSILGGEPQLFLMTAGLFFLYAVFLAPSGRKSGKEGTRRAVCAVLVVLCAVLLTAVQWLPTYVDYQYSARWKGIGYDEAARFSLYPAMLKHLVLPLPFPSTFITDPGALRSLYPETGQMPMLLTVYPGFLILPLALLGLGTAFRKRAVFWAAVFVVATLLALGHHTPLFSLFYALFPFFRFPEKFMFLASVSLLVMGAHGFDLLLSFLRRKSRISRGWYALLAAVLLLDLYVHHKDLNPTCESGFYSYCHPSLRPVLEDPDTFRVYVDEQMPVPSSVSGSIMDHHIRWQMTLMPNLGVLHSLSQLGGRTGLELRYQYFITELVRRPWEERIRFLRMANVKYVVTTVDLEKVAEIQGQVDSVNGLVYRIRDPLPRAWIVGKALGVSAERMDRLVDGSFDPATSVLAREEVAERHTHPYFRGVERIAYDPPGKIRIEVTCDRPGILVLSESSYPGWRVFVDGEEKSCLWLNLLFQGVEIGEGSHQVEFVFRPKTFSWLGPLALILTSLFVACWIAVSARKGKD